MSVYTYIENFETIIYSDDFSSIIWSLNRICVGRGWLPKLMHSSLF